MAISRWRAILAPLRVSAGSSILDLSFQACALLSLAVCTLWHLVNALLATIPMRQTISRGRSTVTNHHLAVRLTDALGPLDMQANGGGVCGGMGPGYSVGDV